MIRSSQFETNQTYFAFAKMYLSYLLLSVFLINYVRTEKTQHTIWLPAGKIAHIPCKIRNLERVAGHELWLHRNEELSVNYSVNSITVWYDRMAGLIHVGEILLVQVPTFESSELSVTQYVPRETAPTDKPMSLTPAYRNWIGGTNQLLQLRHMDSVTCNELQTTTVKGYNDVWNTHQRQTSIGKQVFITFRIYMQPKVIWNFAVPPEIEFENRSVLLQPIEQWCRDRVSAKKLMTGSCSTVYAQRKPFTQLNDPTDSVPLILSTGLAYTEVGVVMDFTNPTLNLIADPTTGELGYLHAKLKYSLDMHILADLDRQLNIEDVEDTITIATRIQAICPPGSHTYMQIPALRNLNFDSLINNSFKISSAYGLKDYQMLCHPCAEGEAPRAAYAYDRCHKCPRGYYLGNTGWPSSAGCLACPDGFTTDMVGATSMVDCVLNAGAVTRWSLGYLLQLWFALEHIIAGEASSQTKTRALGQQQQSAWAWLGKTHKAVWMWGSLYCLVVFWLTAMAIYRLHLYYKLQAVFKRQYRLLFKTALIGQINLVSHIKQRAKQGTVNTDEATNKNEPTPTNE